MYDADGRPGKRRFGVLLLSYLGTAPSDQPSGFSSQLEEVVEFAQLAERDVWLTAER